MSQYLSASSHIDAMPPDRRWQCQAVLRCLFTGYVYPCSACLPSCPPAYPEGPRKTQIRQGNQLEPWGAGMIRFASAWLQHQLRPGGGRGGMSQGGAQLSLPVQMLYLLWVDLCTRCVLTSRVCFSAAFELPARGLFFEQAVGRQGRESNIHKPGSLVLFPNRHTQNHRGVQEGEGSISSHSSI